MHWARLPADEEDDKNHINNVCEGYTSRRILGESVPSRSPYYISDQKM